MKKLLALLLATLMLFSLCACDSEEKTGGEDVAAGKEDSGLAIDFEAEGQQTVSEARAKMDVLVETRDVWLEGKMTFAFADTAKTYEDFVAHIGCDASFYENKAEDGERWFTWVAEEDETAQLLAVFWETPEGWVLYSIGSTNLG